MMRDALVLRYAKDHEMETPQLEQGISTLSSPFGVDETLNRLERLATSRGMTIFARVNFGRDAEKAGLKMQPSQLLILGNPKGGTPLMVAAPRSALDLPLKVLAWADETGRCWVSCNTPEYLQQRHGFPSALIANIAPLGALVHAALEPDAA
jgi:uncharacterized protein (DUF302 family)